MVLVMLKFGANCHFCQLIKLGSFLQPIEHGEQHPSLEGLMVKGYRQLHSATSCYAKAHGALIAAPLT